MNDLMVALPVLIPLFFAVLLIAGRNRPAAAARWNLTACLLQTCAALFLWRKVWHGGIHVTHFGDWPAPFGIVFVSDLLASSMILITAVISSAVAVFMLSPPKDSRHGGIYFACVQGLLMGVNGSFLTGDLFNLFVWFEVMLMASFVLLAFEGRKAQFDGTIKYMVLNTAASMLFLAGAGLLYGSVGTLNMADLGHRIARIEATLPLEAGAVLLFVAFAAKAGLFPVFAWLPASYHTPSPAVSALLAGLLTKVGVYAMIRLSTLIFPALALEAKPLLVVLASLTMIVGVFGAAVQTDIRRILSFHIVSQIGYMILGLAWMTQAALAACFFYVIHHIFVKTNLFLVAGAVFTLRGTTDLKKLGGLSTHAPVLGFLFLIPAFSLAGIPPLSGFFAKFGLIKTGLEDAQFAAVVIALLVSLLTLYSMVKILNEAFWKSAPASSVPSSGRVPLHQMLPIAALAIMTALIGLNPRTLFAVADRISRELLNPALYMTAVLGGS